MLEDQMVPIIMHIERIDCCLIKYNCTNFLRCQSKQSDRRICYCIWFFLHQGLAFQGCNESEQSKQAWEFQCYLVTALRLSLNPKQIVQHANIHIIKFKISHSVPTFVSFFPFNVDQQIYISANDHMLSIVFANFLDVLLPTVLTWFQIHKKILTNLCFF